MNTQDSYAALRTENEALHARCDQLCAGMVKLRSQLEALRATNVELRARLRKSASARERATSDDCQELMAENERLQTRLRMST
jgi:predicted RNase H-like nuclease (RuvC/YqgF family)